MAAIASVSFSAVAPTSLDRKLGAPSSTSYSDAFRLRSNFPSHCALVRPSKSASPIVVSCMSTATVGEVPTVAETKSNFLKAYKRPIPSVYSTVLQELIVQQHLIRYKRTYSYDPVFALGFVTVYDRLMEGYPSDEDREAIFKAYIEALNENPQQYRIDAQKLEDWARTQNGSTFVEFSTREGEVEKILKDIAERARDNKSFSYSRFFAVGLFRLLELANVTEPFVLEKALRGPLLQCLGLVMGLCAALNINKKSVDRDLDVYRNLLSKLVQAKELLREYVAREKKKREDRIAESQKGSEAVKQFSGEYQYATE